jgi:hypothetical protein
MRTRSNQVWVLGSKNQNADRYILWSHKSFPNFHDPDVLIINLSSLDEEVLRYIDKTKFQVQSPCIWSER